jgi:hypothetical protein
MAPAGSTVTMLEGDLLAIDSSAAAAVRVEAARLSQMKRFAGGVNQRDGSQYSRYSSSAVTAI